MADNRFFHRGALPALLVFFCTVSAASSAQAERWYRVELLAFSQRGNELTEKWEPSPQLRYPEVARFLMRPNEATSNLNRVAITPAANAEIGAAAGDALPEELFATAFVLLPPEQHEFATAAASMNRSGRYQVLYHEAWAQPVAAKSDALPIILERSGDTGHWPALQGSIKLHLSRYLHLETNLWLNTNGDYLKGAWRMPAPPLAPASVLNEDGSALLAKLESNAEAVERTSSDASLKGEPNSNLYWLETERPELAPVYPFRHATLLQQNRRMRSKEAHYIDHPMLGLIIKFTPLDTQEVDTQEVDVQEVETDESVQPTTAP